MVRYFSVGSRIDQGALKGLMGNAEGPAEVGSKERSWD